MKELNINCWNRKEVYECFSKYDHPVLSVATRLDITKLVRYSNENGTSFFTNFLYITVKTLNNIPQFRYRIEKKVIQYEFVDASFVVMTDDEKIVTTKSIISGDYSQFYIRNRKNIETDRNSATGFNSKSCNDILFLS